MKVKQKESTIEKLKAEAAKAFADAEAQARLIVEEAKAKAKLIEAQAKLKLTDAEMMGLATPTEAPPSLASTLLAKEAQYQRIIERMASLAGAPASTPPAMRLVPKEELYEPVPGDDSIRDW